MSDDEQVEVADQIAVSDDDNDTSSAGEADQPALPPGRADANKTSIWDAPWGEQRECFLLLLKARMLFRKLLEVKLYEERVTKGALNAIEVRNLVRSQQEDDSSDFVRQITELKRNLMTEIRKNYELEKDVNTLDKKIGLLIHNASAMQQLLQRRRRRRDGAEPSSAIPAERLRMYSNLFYLLQSEPAYLARLVGRVGEEAEGVEALLETILITLYGDAFSPREEYLILTFFRLTVEQELAQLQSTSSFGPDSLLAKAVLAYNRRKQGQEYLANSIGPAITNFTSQQRNLRMDGRKILDGLISEWEVKRGEKSAKRNLNDDEISALPEVAEVVKSRVIELTGAAQMFLDAILSSTQRVPYGLRFIVRQLYKAAQERFPKAKQEEVYKMLSYLVYYRFINLAVVTPGNFKIPCKYYDDADTQMSLVEVSKILQRLFTFSTFDKRAERWYLPLNDWIQSHTGLVRRYLDEIIAVDNPEDVLQVDRYVELTQSVKPTILIAVHELSNMHRFIEQNLAEIAPSADDKMRVIIKELGAAEDYSDEDKVLSLTLENKFPSQLEDAASEGNQMFFQTKTLLISVLRQLPQTLHISSASEEPTLMDILKAGAKWAKEEGNDTMRGNIDTVRSNIDALEKVGLVSNEDGHRALLRAITLEIANRAQIREQQNKELARLNVALRAATKHQQYLTDQYQQYNQYIIVCREHHYAKPGAKKKSKKKKIADGKILGPFKFSYAELVRKHVIADSTIPDLVRRAMKMYITSSEAGVFDIEVRIPAVEPAKLRVDLDDLLEAKSKSQEHVKHQVENAELTLDVNMTIHFLNTLLAKK